MDSYQNFIEYFHITKEQLYEWGIQNTIFPDADRVEWAWRDLLRRIFNNGTVYIRGYGRDAHATELYINFYKFVFHNNKVMKDPTNNSRPHKQIEILTGRKRNIDIVNYQVSHIFGRTKNIFLFEAPWNLCYTPKIIDPFTGHETNGIWPKEYQQLFIEKCVDLYKKYIIEYNAILKKYEIEERILEYIESLEGNIDEKQIERFKKDCQKELSPFTEVI